MTILASLLAPAATTVEVYRRTANSVGEVQLTINNLGDENVAEIMLVPIEKTGSDQFTLAATGGGYLSVPELKLTTKAVRTPRFQVHVELDTISLASAGINFQTGQSFTIPCGTGANPIVTITSVSSSGAVTNINATRGDLTVLKEEFARNGNIFEVKTATGRNLLLRFDFRVKSFDILDRGDGYLEAPVLEFKGLSRTSALATLTTRITPRIEDLLIKRSLAAEEFFGLKDVKLGVNEALFVRLAKDGLVKVIG